MLKDSIVLTGRVQVKLFDKDGNLKQTHEEKNLVVTTGKQWFAKMLAEEGPADITHMAIGTGNTAPAVGDTILAGSELARVAFTDKSRVAATVTMVADFGAGVGTGTVNEAALFDGAAGTTMLARHVFSGPYTKGADDTLQVTWTITVN